MIYINIDKSWYVLFEICFFYYYKMKDGMKSLENIIWINEKIIELLDVILLSYVIMGWLCYCVDNEKWYDW